MVQIDLARWRKTKLMLVHLLLHFTFTGLFIAPLKTFGSYWSEFESSLKNVNVLLAPAPELTGLPFKPLEVELPPDCRQSVWSIPCQDHFHNQLSRIEGWLNATRFGLSWKDRHRFYLKRLHFPELRQWGLLIGFQDTQGPKPLYIFRGGIGSSDQRFGVERALMFSVLFHLKAHVLFIGSSFNDDNLMDFYFSNSGPLKDWEHNLRLASLFKNKVFTPFITKVYLVGISMSGFGAYLAASGSPPWANSEFIKNHYDHVFLVCPYMRYDLQVSPDLFVPSWFWSISRFPRLVKHIPFWKHPMTVAFQRLKWEMEQEWSRLIKQQTLWKDSPINAKWDKIVDYLWEKTSPVTQTTAYYSTKDHLVPPKSNILALNPKNNLKVIEIRHVNHCYFQEGYPSGYIAKLFEINH